MWVTSQPAINLINNPLCWRYNISDDQLRTFVCSTLVTDMLSHAMSMGDVTLHSIQVTSMWSMLKLLAPQSVACHVFFIKSPTDWCVYIRTKHELCTWLIVMTYSHANFTIQQCSFNLFFFNSNTVYYTDLEKISYRIIYQHDLQCGHMI